MKSLLLHRASFLFFQFSRSSEKIERMKIIISPRFKSILFFRGSDQKNTSAESTNPNQRFYLPEVPNEMSFAGEKVPLNRWEIREAFDRELIYNYYVPGHISYIIKLSKRYFPIIEERLKANGIRSE